MSLTNKPDPKTGMNVIWIDPECDPDHTKFIKENLIETFGSARLKVLTVERTGSTDNDWLVTIEKEGITINYEGHKNAMKINWRYLQPVLSMQLEH